MNVNKACNELGYYKILVSIEVIVYLTYNLKGSFVILKGNLHKYRNSTQI